MVQEHWGKDRALWFAELQRAWSWSRTGREVLGRGDVSKSPIISKRATFGEFAVYTTPNSPTAPTGRRRAGVRASPEHPNPQSSGNMAGVRNWKQAGVGLARIAPASAPDFRCFAAYARDRRAPVEEILTARHAGRTRMSCAEIHAYRCITSSPLALPGICAGNAGRPVGILGLPRWRGRKWRRPHAALRSNLEAECCGLGLANTVTTLRPGEPINAAGKVVELRIPSSPRRFAACPLRAPRPSQCVTEFTTGVPGDSAVRAARPRDNVFLSCFSARSAIEASTLVAA
jgi:hypothetical protein